MPKYTMQSLMTAAERALENAGNFLIEANLLTNEGRFGRGLSLSILGREEAQKSILLASCAAGLYDPSDSTVGLEIRRALEDHDYKHESAWYVNAFGIYVISSIFSNEEATKTAVDNLKRIASPKGHALEKKKWRGLYVEIDQSGRVLYPADITEKECKEFMGIATAHLFLATGLHKTLFSDSKPDITPYRLHAEQFRLLAEEKPLTTKKIERLEREGKVGDVMAGFCRFLVEHNLTL